MLLKRKLNLKGWNSQVHRGFPRKSESSTVSRGSISREIGRKHGVKVLRVAIEVGFGQGNPIVCSCFRFPAETLIIIIIIIMIIIIIILI